MTDFKPGDKVQVGVSGTYREDRFGPHIIRDDDGRLFHIADLADVELIRPADDPSKEEVGSVRRGDHSDHKGVMYVVALSDQGVWKALFCGEQGYRIGFDHHEVVGWEKLEPVDGTPAAVALPKVRYFRDRTESRWRLSRSGDLDYSTDGRVWSRSAYGSDIDRLRGDAIGFREVPEP